IVQGLPLKLFQMKGVCQVFQQFVEPLRVIPAFFEQVLEIALGELADEEEEQQHQADQDEVGQLDRHAQAHQAALGGQGHLGDQGGDEQRLKDVRQLAQQVE